ncbi:hypothetical protein MO867_19295 [Microbulbifer sp. OS29]|uniref:YD repeat-containing protein n=1 Tax=Microbulbifer okhotskensis TaxID=2926617 RepID=A0A9X2J9C0_9GAMM|nr:hypothetical protein [Microbulbifer okhotskensis]MCO1336481.1 hypothetical protein [Microbulbifer okhotskensis]
MLKQPAGIGWPGIGSGNLVYRCYRVCREIQRPNETEWKRHLCTAVYTVKTDLDFKVLSTNKLFLYKDFLGSMDLITDEVGNVVQEMSFDTWGSVGARQIRMRCPSQRYQASITAELSVVTLTTKFNMRWV